MGTSLKAQLFLHPIRRSEHTDFVDAPYDSSSTTKVAHRASFHAMWCARTDTVTDSTRLRTLEPCFPNLNPFLIAFEDSHCIL